MACLAPVELVRWYLLIISHLTKVTGCMQKCIGAHSELSFTQNQEHRPTWVLTSPMSGVKLFSCEIIRGARCPPQLPWSLVFNSFWGKGWLRHAWTTLSYVIGLYCWRTSHDALHPTLPFCLHCTHTPYPISPVTLSPPHYLQLFLPLQLQNLDLWSLTSNVLINLLLHLYTAPTISPINIIITTGFGVGLKRKTSNWKHVWSGGLDHRSHHIAEELMKGSVVFRHPAAASKMQCCFYKGCVFVQLPII